MQSDRHLPTLISRMGFNKTTKRLLFFGPPELGAHGFTYTWTDQGIAQLQLLLVHLRQENEIAEALHIVIKHVQLQMGVTGKPFQFLIAPFLRYIEPNWVTAVWLFVDHIQSIVHIKNAWDLTPQRQGDQCLMNIFQIPQFNIHPKEMKRLNACRLYLQVVTVADITDGSGRFVISQYMKGHKCADRTSTWEWPSQLRPSSVAWNLWRKSITRCLCTSLRSLRLHNTLGPWYDNACRHQTWKFQMDMLTMNLIQQPTVGISSANKNYHEYRIKGIVR